MKNLLLVFMKRHFRIVVLSTFVCFMLLTVLPSTVRNFVAPAHAQAATQNPIQAENSLPGTPGWNDFSSDLAPGTLSGYGSKISVNHGDSIDFYVTTTAPSFTIDIYRTGYYGGVELARSLLWEAFQECSNQYQTPIQ